jgi:septum formation protein
MNSQFLNWYGKPVVLASRSPRRAQILKMLAIDFIIKPSNYKEPVNDKLPPDQLVQSHAYYKAEDVARLFENAWIIGADTVVIKAGQRLGKPTDRDEAIRMLKLLSGIRHQVFTGYCVLNSFNHKYVTEVVRTDVTFRKLTDELIQHYIDQYQPFDKAGSYGIQDFSAVFIDKIEGCFYNVVGFPVAQFYQTVTERLSSIR